MWNDVICKFLIISESQCGIPSRNTVLYAIFPPGYVTSYHPNQVLILKFNLIQAMIPLYNYFSFFFSGTEMDWSGPWAKGGRWTTPVHLSTIFRKKLLKIVSLANFRQTSISYKHWSIQRNIIRYLVVLSFGSSSRLFFLWVLLIDWSLLLVLSYLVLVLSCLISCFALSFLVLFCSG